MSEEVSFKDFKKLNIRIGTVSEIEKVPGSDKLYKMQVDLGDETRQIVTGLVDYYSPEELKDRTIYDVFSGEGLERIQQAVEIAFSKGEAFEEAGRKIIDVLLEKPAYDEGHAKAVMLALFKHLGLRHPVSEKLSRSFSMAVNV